MAVKGEIEIGNQPTKAEKVFQSLPAKRKKIKEQ